MSTALEAKLQRSQRKVELLEEMLETKTRELFTAHEEVKSSARFMSSVICSMAGALLVVNPNGEVQLVNKRLLCLLGYPEDEVLGRPVSKVLPHAGSYRTTTESDASEEETVFLTSAGTEIPVSLTNAKVIDGEEIIGHVYVAMDIRERKKTESRLADSQRKLVEASRHAGMAQVASGVIHNVGNVLTSVKVTAEVLLEQATDARARSVRRLVELLNENAGSLGPFMASEKGKKVPAFLGRIAETLETDNSERRNELQQILQNLDHIAAVIQSQQELASVGQGAQEPVELDEIVSAALEMYQHQLTSERIRVQTHFGAPSAFMTDRHAVLQILVNFLSNAIEASSQAQDSELTITIETGEKDGELFCSVRDTGSGIEPGDIPQLFQHGFTTKASGHGFGLHSSANTATSLGGRIDCESEGKGRGACFTVSLPRSASSKEAA